MTGRYKAYPDYRKSMIEWMHDVPAHWHNVPLKYMAIEDNSLFLDGDWIESKDISSKGIRYITTGNVGEGIYKEQGAGFISEDTFKKLSCTEVFEGDLLLSRLNAPIGRSCIVPNLSDRIVTSVDNVIFRPDSQYLKQFLVYLFSSSSYFKHTSNLARGATMQRISRGLLGNIRVVVPTCEEQQKIANFLDHETAKIDTLITKQEKLIELLKEKRQAVISHAVTKGLNPDAPMKDSGVEWLGEVPEHWKACPLKTISKFRQGKLHEPYIHEDGKFICVNSRFVSTEGEKFKYCSKNLSPVENKDILMVMSDLPNGRALAKALFVQGDNNFALNQRVCAITATEIDARFLYYQLNRNEYFLSLDDGCNQTNLSNYVFKNFPALVPYKAEQCEIAEYLDRQTESFDRLVEIANRQIELMKERKTALISAAVTGKIDVRDWQGEA